MFMQIIIGAVAEGMLYALMALALAIVLYPMRVFHVAIGGIFVGAAYLLGVMTAWFGLPLFIGISVSVLASIGIGVVVEMWVYQPLSQKRASTLPVAISSFAVYFILVNAFAMVTGNQQMIVTSGCKVSLMGGVVLSETQIAIMVSGIIVFGLLIMGLRTRFGKVLRGMEDNPDLLRACGWKIGHVRLALIMISSFLSGIVGILTALDKGVEPGMGMPIVLNGLVVVIAAGAGVYRGIFGIAIGLAFIQSVLGYMVSPIWSVAASFAVLTAFLVFRPGGLFSISKRVEELE